MTADPNIRRVILGRIVRAAVAERARPWGGTWTVYILRRRGVLRWADSRGIVQTEHGCDGALELEARDKHDAERRGLELAW